MKRTGDSWIKKNNKSKKLEETKNLYLFKCASDADKQVVALKTVCETV